MPRCPLWMNSERDATGLRPPHTSSSVPGAKYIAHLPATFSCTHRNINDDSRISNVAQPRPQNPSQHSTSGWHPAGRSYVSHDLSRGSDTLSGIHRGASGKGEIALTLVLSQLTSTD